MDAKLFKNFHCFVATGETDQPSSDDITEYLANYEASDPVGSQWRQMGFLPIEGDMFAIDVQGAATLACVQVNERILPGAVQREKMLERIASIEERQGRKIGKKEYAELKDEVIFELLPQAFIRRKLVPIMFVKDRVLVFTSSAKLCDDVVSLLVRASTAAVAMKLANLAMLAQNSITGSLTTLAKEGSSANPDLDFGFFNVANGMVLKGEGKKTITVKDKDVQDVDIQALLKQAYEVVKLRLDFIEEAGTEEVATFTINEHLVFTAMLLKDVDFGKEKDAADAAAKFLTIAWMTARIAYEIVSYMLEVMGRVAAETVIADDDEL